MVLASRGRKIKSNINYHILSTCIYYLILFFIWISLDYKTKTKEEEKEKQDKYNILTIIAILPIALTLIKLFFNIIDFFYITSLFILLISYVIVLTILHGKV